MASDRLGFRFEGEVSFEVFEASVKHFNAFLSAIAAESTSEEPIQWIVGGLSDGSTEVIARGITEDKLALTQAVRNGVQAFRALEGNQEFPFPISVQGPLVSLTGYVNGSIPTVRFLSDDGVVASVDEPRQALPEAATTRSLGSIQGTIENLYHRTKRFLVVDDRSDEPVICSFSDWRDESMRDYWLKKVIVRGWITRDLQSGHPRRVLASSVSAVDEPEAGGFRRARGALPRGADDPRAEDVIRRIRDAQ